MHRGINRIGNDKGECILPYVDKQTIARAREMDLLTYLQRANPGELVRVSGSIYSLRNHDSFKISNGKWFWWSRGFGGKSALDYLTDVQGLRLPEAVEEIARACGLGAAQVQTAPRQRAPVPKAPFVLPEAHTDHRRVFAYLCSRGIAPEIINHCIKHGILYEDGAHHNAVFVGYDPQRTARYAMLRGTLSESVFVWDVAGSDKRYGFCLGTEQPCDTVYVFESAIDALSGATLCGMKGNDWRGQRFLSLGGVAALSKTSASQTPRALEEFLKTHPDTRRVVLCLDNDTAGRIASKEIAAWLLSAHFEVWDCPPKRGKDYNELLQIKKGIRARAKTRGQGKER